MGSGGGAPDPAILLYHHAYTYGPLMVEGFHSLKEAAQTADRLVENDGIAEAIETVASDGIRHVYEGEDLRRLVENNREPPSLSAPREPEPTVLVRAPSGICSAGEEWAEVDLMWCDDGPYELLNHLAGVLGPDRVRIENR